MHTLTRRLGPTVAGLIFATLAVTACASSGATSGAGSAGGTPHESPLPVAPATWQLGGTYTGPVPPVPGLPGPAGGLQLAPFTDARGYTIQSTIRVGAPLHYDIPQVLADCYTAYPDQRQDLDPGQYIIPVQIVMTNKTGQEATGLRYDTPDIYATDSTGEGTAPAPVTDGLHMLWGDGSCRMDVGQNIPVGGQVTLNGYIGPATAAQLSQTWLRINGAGHQYQERLTTLEPHKTASWLISHG